MAHASCEPYPLWILTGIPKLQHLHIPAPIRTRASGKCSLGAAEFPIGAVYAARGDIAPSGCVANLSQDIEAAWFIFTV